MNRWRKISCFLIAGLSSMPGMAEAVAPLPVPVIDTVPVIDGKLDEAFYRDMKFHPLSEELAHSGKSDIAIVEGKATRLDSSKNGTRFAVFYNRQGLYLALCSPFQGKLAMDCTLDDGLFEFFRNNDAFEVLIDPRKNGRDYYWFITNPAGCKTDLCALADPDRSWNGVWQTASTVENGVWQMEMFLPFATFSRLGLASEFGLNLARFFPDGFKRRIWGGEYRMPGTWRTCTLGGFDPATAVAPFRAEQIEIADEHIPGEGLLRAELQLPADQQVDARWHVMCPMRARGWQPEACGPRETVAAEVTRQEGKTVAAAKIGIGDDEAVIAALALYDRAGNLLYLSPDRVVSKRHAIGGPGSEFSYYTTEKSVDFRLELAVLQPEMQLTARLLSPEGEVLAQQEFAKPERVLEFGFDSALLPVGESRLEAALTLAGKQVAKRDFPVLRLAPNPAGNEVKYSRFDRSVHVDGAAFAIIGNSPQIAMFGLDFGRNRMREMAEHGFNTMHVWGGYYTVKDDTVEIDPDRLKAIYDMAEENGLKVILYMGEFVGHAPHSPFLRGKLSDEERIELVRQVVNLSKDRKSLLAYEPYDEPEFFLKPEYLEKIYRVIKELDPYHLVTLNNCRSSRAILQFLRATDMVSIDYYPIGKWPAESVTVMSREMTDFPGYKPVRWWIQGYKIFNPAAPTPEELKAMTGMVWAHGASAVFYFIGRPEEPLWQAQGECVKMNRDYAEAITADRRRTLKLEPPGSAVFASLRGKGGRWVVMAVNESAREQTVRIRLPEGFDCDAAEAAKNAVQCKEGVLTGVFSPYEGKMIDLKIRERKR